MKYLTDFASAFFLDDKPFLFRTKTAIPLLELRKGTLLNRLIFTSEFQIVVPLHQHRQIFLLDNSQIHILA